MDVGRAFSVPVRRRGTLYRDICVMILFLYSVYSALQAVFGVDAQYKFTFCLLTYFTKLKHRKLIHLH